MNDTIITVLPQTETAREHLRRSEVAGDWPDGTESRRHEAHREHLQAAVSSLSFLRSADDMLHSSDCSVISRNDYNMT